MDDYLFVDYMSLQQDKTYPANKLFEKQHLMIFKEMAFQNY